MTRLSLVAAAALVAGVSGCSSPAKVVARNPEAGSLTVAIPDNTDVWPTYFRRSALAMAEKEFGLHPERYIVDERLVPVGQRTDNNQTVNGQMVQGMTTTTEVTQYQITFQKRPQAGGPGGIQQTQYMPGSGGGVQPAGGIVPSVQPGAGRGVVPAAGH